MTQEPLFTRVLDPLQECPKYAPRVPLPAFASTSFEASIFEKLAITTPVFSLFLPPQSHETIINSHFHILEG
jgi:hypothetical protein